MAGKLELDRDTAGDVAGTVAVGGLAWVYSGGSELPLISDYTTVVATLVAMYVAWKYFRKNN